MRTALLGSCLLLCPALGCSSDHDAVEKRLSGLRDDITRLQSENDRLGERVDSLEAKGSAPPPKSAAPSAESAVEHPTLKVVKLMPGDAVSSNDEGDVAAVSPDELPDAPGSRPVIRLRGKQDGRQEGKESRTEDGSK